MISSETTTTTSNSLLGDLKNIIDKHKEIETKSLEENPSSTPTPASTNSTSSTSTIIVPTNNTPTIFENRHNAWKEISKFCIDWLSFNSNNNNNNTTTPRSSTNSLQQRQPPPPTFALSQPPPPPIITTQKLIQQSYIDLVRQLLLSVTILNGGIDFVTKQISLSKEQTSLLVKYCSADSLIDALSQHIAVGNVSFPFKRNFVGDPQVMFQRLRNYRSVVKSARFSVPNIRFNSGAFFDFTFDVNQYVSFEAADCDYNNIDVIVDIFQVNFFVFVFGFETLFNSLSLLVFKRKNLE